MNNELINHLKNVNNKSLIGLGIQELLLREEEVQRMLLELKSISMQYPEIMIPIIGNEAYSLLTSRSSDFSMREYSYNNAIN